MIVPCDGPNLSPGQRPNDADATTDLGLTYFLMNPPDLGAAEIEFQKSLKINPKHEKTLQAIIQILTTQDKKVEAGKYLARLKEVNPNNRILSEKTPASAELENNLPKQ